MKRHSSVLCSKCKTLVALAETAVKYERAAHEQVKTELFEQKAISGRLRFALMQLQKTVNDALHYPALPQ